MGSDDIQVENQQLEKMLSQQKHNTSERCGFEHNAVRTLKYKESVSESFNKSS